MDRTQKAALASAGIGLVVMGLKFSAYWLTGSLALYSDALESIINVVAAAGAFVALRVAGWPADAEHPYGHHKAEFFSAVIEGALIIVAIGNCEQLVSPWFRFHQGYNPGLGPRPPEPGARVEHLWQVAIDGLTLTVESTDGRRVSKVLVVRSREATEPEDDEADR